MWGAKETQRVDAERVATNACQQRQFNDTASGRHAATVANLSNKLGDARAQIAELSADRQCLDARTVSMLKTLGQQVRSACEPLPANLRIRPQPQPELKLTVPPAPAMPASGTRQTG